MSIVARLGGIVGTGAVISGGDMAPHLTDWRGRYTGHARCVVKPASTEEVAAVVALCAEERIPMVPQGGNTGLVGGATPLHDGQVLVAGRDQGSPVEDEVALLCLLDFNGAFAVEMAREAVREAGRHVLHHDDAGHPRGQRAEHLGQGLRPTG